MNAAKILLIAVLASGTSALLGDDDDAQPPPTNAPVLLRQVIAQLPSEPMEITGTLTIRRKRADIIKQHRYYMRLDWGLTRQAATYSIMDMSGKRLGKMDIARESGILQRKYYPDEGDNLSTNMPPLTARVQGTDVTWLDLSLDFLWWQGAELDGTDKYLNRLCDIVMVPAPDGLQNCAAAKLWIDRKMRTLLRAEQINSRGETTRGMWVKSVKKHNDYWMIKNMEIQSFPGDHRTRLHVQDMSILPR